MVQDLRRDEAITAEFRGDLLDIIVDPRTNAVSGLWWADGFGQLVVPAGFGLKCVLALGIL
jgi:hypothetical protein